MTTRPIGAYSFDHLKSATHHDTPMPPRLPEVDYTLKPRPLPISGAFPADQLAALIEQLPDPRWREIVTLRHVHGYQWDDIASAMAYDRTAIWRMHKCAIAEINRHVRQMIQPAPLKKSLNASVLLTIGLLLGGALVAALWWIVDTALLTSPVEAGTVWLADVDSLRPWFVAVYFLGCVPAWFARGAFERMPVAENKKAPSEAATSTESRPKKSTTSYTAGGRLSREEA